MKNKNLKKRTETKGKRKKLKKKKKEKKKEIRSAFGIEHMNLLSYIILLYYIYIIL